MAGPDITFPLKVARALETADFAIRHMRSEDHRKLYNLVRVTMSTIAPVDSFYVAFFRDEQLLVIPYVYDERGYEDAGFQAYGPDGLTAWIRKHERPYLYSTDDGRLLNRGYTFGNHEKLSSDAIAIPLWQPTDTGPQVVGLTSILTYQPSVYDEGVVRAFEWLARRMMKVLARENEDRQDRAELTGPGKQGAPTHGSVPDVIDIVGRALNDMQNMIAAVLHRSPDTDAAIRCLRDVLEQCQRLHTDIAEILLMPTSDAYDLFAKLTPREQEVAQLIADGLTNDQIADRLVISEKTAKTHVTRILKKFGVRQRSAVAAKLRRF